MGRWFALAGATLFAVSAAVPAATLAQSPNDDVEVVCAQFGLFDEDAAGHVLFTPSTKVPLTVGQNFGWVVLLRARAPAVRWREEFQAPSPPKTWGPIEPGRTISPDGTVSLSDHYAEVRSGIVTHAWQITEGDPTGHYVMRVLLGGTALQIFEFEGVSGAEARGIPAPSQPVEKAMQECAGAISRATEPEPGAAPG